VCYHDEKDMMMMMMMMMMTMMIYCLKYVLFSEPDKLAEEDCGGQ